jgi:glycosyltransferase involved in cell wall biosynthesis
MECVSVIIPTYNRFNLLLNTLESIKSQTFSNIEIIVVNDCSTEKEYYEYKWKDNGINIIHLEKNTKDIFGYACVGHVINKGIEKSSGEYIAFCDDDDIWFPSKIELQLNAMKITGCNMSSTDGFIGFGVFDKDKSYQKILTEYYFSILKLTNSLNQNYLNRGYNILEDGYPKIWKLDFIKIHNCIIASSVIIHKDIISKIGKQLEIKMGGVLINDNIVHIDYDYWLRALEYTNNVYVNEICVYYDAGHGNGKNY